MGLGKRCVWCVAEQLHSAVDKVQSHSYLIGQGTKVGVMGY